MRSIHIHPSEHESFMAQPFRTDDAVLTLCQNNLTQAIEISAATSAAAALLGYEAEELTGMEIQALLPKKIVSAIAEYVEFQPGGNDLGTVLGRVKDFSLLDKKGAALAVEVKITRSESQDQNDWFKLILKAGSGWSEKEKLLEMLHRHFHGHEVLDRDFGIPNRNSLIRNVEMAASHAATAAIALSFAAVTLDRHSEWLKKYSRSFCVKALKGIADSCRQNLRAHDAIGMLGESSLGVILLDISPKSSRIVLNRLRWLVGAKLNILTDLPQEESTVSIAWSPVSGKNPNVVTECEEALTAHARNGGANATLELPESPEQATRNA